MSRRYNEFRLELIEDHANLASTERHVRELRAEIEAEKAKPSDGINLRLSYAQDELEAALDHIKDIKEQMALEEAESA